MSSTVSTTTTNNPLVPQFNIGGLASGLDTNSIISAEMAVEQVPQQQIINQETLEQTRQTDLQSIQAQLSLLSGAIATLISPSTWTTQQQVSSSDPTRITASGTGVPPGGFSLTVSQLARAAQLTQSTSLQSANADDTLTIQIGSGTAYNVSIASGDSLATIATKINTQTGTKLFASVVSNQLVLSSQVTGSANTIAVSSTGTLASDLGLTQTVSPQDAQYTVDGGATQTSASNVLTNVASGLSLTLLGTTSSPVSVTVNTPGPNTSAIESAIQSFVTTYNQTVDLINSKLTEKKVVNPQNDADRAAGDLEDDPTLMSIVSQLREAVTNIFPNAPSTMSTLASVGLSTGAAVGTGTVSQTSLNGDLTLDTTALESALNTNFAAVKTMFSNVGTASTQGLAQRLNGVVGQFIGTNGIVNSRIASETTLINQLASEKAEWDVRLNQYEASLREKYTNMETAMQQAQSQGQWLNGQISGLSSSSSSSTSKSSSSSSSSSSS